MGDESNKNQPGWAPGQAPWDREHSKPDYQRPAGKTLLGFRPEVPDGEVLPFEDPDAGPPDVVNDFETWARVSARLLKRKPKERKQILAELELEFIWPDANERWSAVLAQEVVDERDRRTKQYGAICAEEMKRRRSGADKKDEQPSSFIKSRPKSRVKPAPRRPAGEDGPPTVRRPQMVGSTVVQEPTIDFIDRLAPPDIQPETPQPGQQSTAAQDMRHVTSAIQAANVALEWPIEKFAKFCAEMDHEPNRHQLIAAHYGLRDEAIEFVREGWQERLDADAELSEQWATLVAQYRRHLQSTRPVKPPPQ